MVEREGGVQRVVWEIAKRYAEQGHQVHLYTNSCPELPHPSVVFHKVPMLMSRPFRKSQNPWVKAMQVWSFAWFSRMAVSRQKFDIVHVHGDSLAKADVRSAHSCHKAWIKYELSRDSSVGNVLKKRLNPLHSIVLLIEYYNYSLKGVSKILSDSGSVKQQIVETYHINEDRIDVVPTGVDCKEFVVPNDFDIFHFRQRHDIPNEAEVMTFIGWEFGRKGLSTLLEAMSKLPSDLNHLLVVGGDNEKPFIKQANNLGIAYRVHFVGAQADFRPYLWGSDIFVLPTRYDPCPLVVWEAMAAGLPVIVSKCAGNSEWLEDGVEGYLLDNPFDAMELACAISRIFCDTKVLSKMGETAQQKAKAVDWDRVVEMTLKVYESIVEGRALSRP